MFAVDHLVHIPAASVPAFTGEVELTGLFDWPGDIVRTELEKFFLHMILPWILFIMAFLVLVFAPLPIVIRLIIVALIVLLGLYLGGWLHIGGLIP